VSELKKARFHRKNMSIFNGRFFAKSIRSQTLSRSRDGAAVSHQAERREAGEPKP